MNRAYNHKSNNYTPAKSLGLLTFLASAIFYDGLSGRVSGEDDGDEQVTRVVQKI